MPEEKKFQGEVAGDFCILIQFDWPTPTEFDQEGIPSNWKNGDMRVLLEGTTNLDITSLLDDEWKKYFYEQALEIASDYDEESDPHYYEPY